ncbi:regulatory protein GemA [Labrenzia sp. CE80]|uniref:regulatory protein GemA n=1 Tax=Labrenzia sp. CE80 TaxID=1788986 RepID=UPI00129AF1BD|nr:regulatory protein GemA [Labrenzia sp. CE80]
MSFIAKIHVLKRDCGLDDDTYRDLLHRETGKRSSADMNEAERRKVITVLEGLKPASNPYERATGKFARKLQALWIAGYNLGVIKNRSDKAMIAFLKRQTGLDHVRFLQDASDADKAIDALKAILRRQTGNDGLFRKDQSLPPAYNDFRFQVCLHIWSELIRKDAAPAGSLTAYLADKTGKDLPTDFSDREWIEVQNDLGRLLRTSIK